MSPGWSLPVITALFFDHTPSSRAYIPSWIYPLTNTFLCTYHLPSRQRRPHTSPPPHPPSQGPPYLWEPASPPPSYSPPLPLPALSPPALPSQLQLIWGIAALNLSSSAKCSQLLENPARISQTNAKVRVPFIKHKQIYFLPFPARFPACLGKARRGPVRILCFGGWGLGWVSAISIASVGRSRGRGGGGWGTGWTHLLYLSSLLGVFATPLAPFMLSNSSELRVWVSETAASASLCTDQDVWSRRPVRCQMFFDVELFKGVLKRLG